MNIHAQRLTGLVINTAIFETEPGFQRWRFKKLLCLASELRTDSESHALRSPVSASEERERAQIPTLCNIKFSSWSNKQLTEFYNYKTRRGGVYLEVDERLTDRQIEFFENGLRILKYWSLS